MSESPQGLFPDVIALQFAAFSSGVLESTDIEVAYSGREVRRGRFALGGYRTAEATTVPLSQVDAELLRTFMRARRGKLQSFYLFVPDSEYLNNFVVGTVAAATTLQVALKGLSLSLVTVDDVPKTVTITENFGTYGEAKITFVAGAQTGVVRVTGFARPQLLVRSDLDDYKKSFLVTADFRTIWSLKFREVK